MLCLFVHKGRSKNGGPFSQSTKVTEHKQRSSPGKGAGGRRNERRRRQHSVVRWIVILAVLGCMLALMYFERSKLLAFYSSDLVQGDIVDYTEDGAPEVHLSPPANRENKNAKKKKSKQFQVGDHVWIASEHQGATLSEKMSDEGTWNAVLDSGYSGQFIEVNEDGESNIVPFLSKRQRIQKSRLKQLLEVHHHPLFSVRLRT
mgnify:CR=1 FL=1